MIIVTPCKGTVSVVVAAVLEKAFIVSIGFLICIRSMV